MEYQKIINLLENASNQPSKFWVKNWVEINDESRGAYNVNSHFKFKTTMLNSYILVKGTITVSNTGTAAAPNNKNKKVIFENCAPFINCISEINNTQLDNAEDIDIVMPMYNLIEYSDNYSKIFGILWLYSKDIPAADNNGDIIDFNGANATGSFNSKTKINGQTNNGGEIDNVEIMVPLKYLSNFWRTLEMPLINCEVIILNWSENYVIVYTDVVDQGATFTIAETKRYVPVVTLSTQDNAKLLRQLKSGFKRTINWNKC